MIRKVKYLDYFEIVEHSAKDIYTLPFEFKYYVEEEPEKLFIAAFDGLKYTNCAYSFASNALTVYFTDQHLGHGNLVCEKTFKLPFVGADGKKIIAYKDSSYEIEIVDDIDEPGDGQNLINKELRDSINVIGLKTDELKSADASQNIAIAKNTSSIEELTRQVANNATGVESIASEQSKQGQKLADYQSATNQSIKKIEAIIAEPCECELGKMKGSYTTLALLLTTHPLPEVGDFAFVQIPAKIADEEFNTSYWGSKYLGDKASKQAEWHVKTTSAKGCYFIADETYYRVNGDVALQLLADSTIEELLEHEHITALNIGSYAEGETIPMYTYRCEAAGEWTTQYTNSSIAAAEYTDAGRVYDGTKQQSRMNAVDMANAATTNSNTEQLQTVVNKLVKFVNAIAPKLVLTEGETPVRIEELTLAALAAEGEDNHMTLDFSTFPLILT